ncbi:hypothetical protein K2173_021264 [Erythroxylum novogranatense]|uniref:Uncharacterized protein n=1 Tax=Erythroxylum novogranatense TaxID=1862640 RepID=A0AAV8TUC5_9ROSI|nr:hypothetical protein K2173_021264 [Erythroxylum novogranatense]
MSRVPSTRSGRYRYEQLSDESATEPLEARLRRASSSPAKICSASNNSAAELTFSNNAAPVKPSEKLSKCHPFFSLFDGRRKKKPVARTDFSRYMEYVKEGGLWDRRSNMPVMYYK